MKLEPFFASLLSGKGLRRAEAYRLFLELYDSRLKKENAKALLLLLARKGETPEEVLGCLQALQKFEGERNLRIRDLMDTCGTGGDRSGSVNVSTLVAFVLAAGGVKVAKHGNRSVSSHCGSSDLMQALGVKIDCPPARMIRAVRRCGLGYFHAPFYHPVFSKVQSLRRELKIQTVFNLLGPLANPFKIQRQLLGVANPNHLELFAKVLQKKGRRLTLVVHSEDGMDEISTSAPTRLAWVRKNQIVSSRLVPKKYGIAKSQKKDWRAGSLKKNRRLSLRLLKGRLRGPVLDLIALNAAAGFVVAGKAADFKQGLALAKKILSSGRAYETLVCLRKISRGRPA